MAVFNFRKVKILTLVVLLFAVNGVLRTNGLIVPDLVHLIKNGTDGEEGLCIAWGEDTYSAIDWTYPIPDNEDGLPETASSYLPQYSSSNYDCNFEEDQECNSVWKLANWTIPKHTVLNYVPIYDTRWEDFRIHLTTNRTKIIDNRFEIPDASTVGISIRSSNSVDILICEGFNPESYPCYTITLGGENMKHVYVRKYGVNKTLSEYTDTSPILSSDEWNTFELFVTKTGTIHLYEVSKKHISYIDIKDPTPLKSLYLFLNSSLPALWKIHRNHFLYTGVSQSVPFGPPINITSSTVCLSMYLMMCSKCSLHFYTNINNKEETVLDIRASNNFSMDFKWNRIELLMKNVTKDIIQLYIKTNGNARALNFWAIDNVRTCVKDEFKVRKLAAGNFTQKLDMSKSVYSCHSLKFPEWRPKMQRVPITELPEVFNTPSATSIQLWWKTRYEQPFLIRYQGSDICSKDTLWQYKSKDRLMSNGWFVVKPKENTISIKGLVPFTHYYVSFIDPVYGADKNISLNTKFTIKPKKEEIPTILIMPKATEAKIILSARKCNVSFGPIVNKINIVQQSNQSRILMDENTYTLKGLEPFTNYTLSVETARTINSLKTTILKEIMYYNFTTMPEVAPQVDKLEVYECSETSVSLRYKLSKKLNGVPTQVHISFCNSLLRNGCDFVIANISRCHIWQDLYCQTITNLMKNQEYTFKLSIKNNNTNAFGKEVEITKRTKEEVPGVPNNLTYHVFGCNKEKEYCHLNVTWAHPYYQNGVITSFKILLEDNDNDTKAIWETFPVNNKKYLPVYWHVVQYLPYSRGYKLSITACNGVRRSLKTSILVEIGQISHHVNIVPRILLINTTEITFQIPKLDSSLNSSTVIVIVQMNDTTHANVSENILSLIGNELCLSNKTSWIAGASKIPHDEAINITIGSNSTTFSDILNETIVDNALNPNTEYCINFVTTSIYKNTEHVVVYHSKHVTLSNSKETSGYSPNTLSIAGIIVITLLILLITAVIAFTIYRRRKPRPRIRTRSQGEHIYEAMPADDNDSYNVVYNAIYDRLNHDDDN